MSPDRQTAPLREKWAEGIVIAPRVRIPTRVLLTRVPVSVLRGSEWQKPRWGNGEAGRQQNKRGKQKLPPPSAGTLKCPLCSSQFSLHGPLKAQGKRLPL